MSAQHPSQPKAGERIKKAREDLGWTQERLATEAKISKSFLSDVERGERDISAGYLLKIANALGASLNYLLRGTVEPTERTENIEIPRELSEAAEQLNLSYSQTLTVLQAHNSIVARRSYKQAQRSSVQDWIELAKAIAKVYDKSEAQG
jgi:transcriptional regulator with XRE-family HTH domain